MTDSMEGLRFERPLEWREVFECWRGVEEGRVMWEKYLTQRGFSSWEEWRSRYVEDLRLSERAWSLHRIDDHRRTVPTLIGGPFRTWIEKHYDGAMTRDFAWLAKRQEIREHPRINDIIENFPDGAVVIGVQTSEGIVIIEGMHRCCALARAAAEGVVIETDLHIALGSSLAIPLPVVGGYVKNEREK